MFLLSHPTGNSNVRAVLAALSDQGLLTSFITTVGLASGDSLPRLLPSKLLRQMKRRSYSLPAERVIHRPQRELIRMLAGRSRLMEPLTTHETGWASIDAVTRDLDNFTAQQVQRQINSRKITLKGVYCYEDCAVKTFRTAKEAGLLRLYDLPIGYWRAGQKIFQEELEREPEWARTLSGLRDSPAKLVCKDEEIALADQIFVATSYTRSTLALCPTLIPSIPVHLAAYGAPEPISSEEFEAVMGVRISSPRQYKIRVLFVGSLGQRKGISYLLQAITLLKGHVELTLIGAKPDAECRPLEQALHEHRWLPSLPHSEVLAEMQRHDVLVFPSLFEGFGLVILEAMSRGLPVITTPNTAGPDVITEGKDGFIVPIRSAESIVERLSLFLDQPERLQEMKRAALEKAHQTTWSLYKDQLGLVFKTLADDTQPVAT